MLQDDISYLGESAYLGPACERMQPSGTLKWRCLRENPRAYNFRLFRSPATWENPGLHSAQCRILTMETLCRLS
jgi:hypothetical protein